ncbi:Uncharacterised protein [Bordetella pertussis]|nr:Uncharacterised protein [Bordetella pertussis]
MPPYIAAQQQAQGARAQRAAAQAGQERTLAALGGLLRLRAGALHQALAGLQQLIE